MGISDIMHKTDAIHKILRELSLRCENKIAHTAKIHNPISSVFTDILKSNFSSADLIILSNRLVGCFKIFPKKFGINGKGSVIIKSTIVYK